MTMQEFLIGYNELIEHFGSTSFSKKRAALIYESVKDLSKDWWISIVHRMIRINDGRFDIDAAAKLEISMIRSYERLNDSQAWTNLTKEMSKRGLDETLNKLGFKSLSDAVFKNKK